MWSRVLRAVLARPWVARGGTWLTTPSVACSPATHTHTHTPTRSSLRAVHVGGGAGQEAGLPGGAFSRPHPLPITVAASVPQPDASMMKVQWGTGDEDLYPYIWLRDNCQCPSCFHQSSVGRRVQLRDLHLTVTPSDVKVSECMGKVEVMWSDGHLGLYPASWLHGRAFVSPQEDHLQFIRLRKEHWGSELQEKLPRASFPALLRDDNTLLTFLEALEVYGLVLVSKVPREVGQIRRLTQRVGGFLKVTHYGETFQVMDKSNSNNLAYTTSDLDLHCDMPYLEHKPGIQLLHCISQFPGEGGDSLLADSFHAAQRLRHNNPEEFRVLSDTLIDFRSVGSDQFGKFHATCRIPTIQLDSDGNIENVNMNQMQRDSKFKVDLELAVAWYRAVLSLRDLLYDPGSLVKHKMQPGEMIVLDNMRVLHGRRGYNTSQGDRFLEGAYWSWDEVRSRRRVLHLETLQQKHSPEGSGCN